MAQRRRKRGRREKQSGQSGSPPAIADSPARSRAEERNAAVRAALIPLAPGERPRAVTVGAIIAAVLGLGSLIAYLAGARTKLAGKPPGIGEIVVYAALMLVCAGGMWRLRYWAVLGFQTLLAIALLGFTLALVRASSLLGGAICIVLLAGGGFLFIKLVRALSRIQMPRYPGR